MAPQTSGYQFLRTLHRVEPKELRPAAVMALASIALALAATFFQVYVLRRTLNALRGEGPISYELVSSLTESIWLHVLILIAVSIGVLFLHTRLIAGLVASVVIALTLDICLLRWLQTLEVSGFGWPRLDGPNAITTLLFIALLLRVVGELSVLAKTLRSRRTSR